MPGDELSAGILFLEILLNRIMKFSIDIRLKRQYSKHVLSFEKNYWLKFWGCISIEKSALQAQGIDLVSFSE
jgi:hypothetical protein